MSDVTAFNRTLEQELLALLRGASLECPVCGEFVLQQPDGLSCPECGSWLRGEVDEAEPGLHLPMQAG